METVGLKSKAGQAKLLGTAVCVGGAMLLSFYHGAPINIGESHIHWKFADAMRDNNPGGAGGSSILGPILILLSCVAWAAWSIVQVYRACILNNEANKLQGKPGWVYSSGCILYFQYIN